MDKNKFMERLEYLLSDIPEEDKEDAIAYYRDYLEEAGEHADKAIEEFGSPERIASIIRSDLAGNLESGGAFTERGYEDERFRDPNYQVVKRFDLPETKEIEDDKSWNKGSETYESERKKTAPRTNRGLKFMLWIILLLVASPLWLGAGGVLFGLTAGAAGLLLGAILLLGSITFALLLGGVGLCVVGILSMLKWIPGGLLMFGSGVAIIGLGIISLIVSILFYGRLIPWMIRCIVDAISRLVHGRRKAR